MDGNYGVLNSGTDNTGVLNGNHDTLDSFGSSFSGIFRGNFDTE